MAELQIDASLLRLATPLSTSHLDVDALNRALRSAERRPMPVDDDPKTGLEVVKGREWIHIDGTGGKTAGNNFESYGTLIDGSTVFFVSASYSAAIRLNQSWFDSRRELLRAVRDQAVVRTP